MQCQNRIEALQHLMYEVLICGQKGILACLSLEVACKAILIANLECDLLVSRKIFSDTPSVCLRIVEPEGLVIVDIGGRGQKSPIIRSIDVAAGV